MQFIQLNILWNTDCAENHRTLSHNRGRFCRIARLPYEGEAFAANRHVPKVPPDEGGTQGG